MCAMCGLLLLALVTRVAGEGASFVLSVPAVFQVLHCTVLYCTVLYCTVLYCTVLYCAGRVAGRAAAGHQVPCSHPSSQLLLSSGERSTVVCGASFECQ